MSEILGPVERIDRISADVDWLNNEISATLQPVPYEETVALLAELEDEHPLLGEDIIIYGTRLTASMEDSTMNPLSITPDRVPGHNKPLQGVYHGYDRRRIYLPDSDDWTEAIVHIIETGKDSYLDEYHNQVTRTTLNYVIAEGSSIHPTFPQNAHSFRDLQGSKSIEEFDRVAYDESLGIFDKLHHLGHYASALFRNQSHLMDLNYQRVSYLNSIGLLEDVDIFADSFMSSDRLSYMDGTSMPMIASGFIAMREPLFDILPGYEVKPSGAIKILEPPELFVGLESEGNWLSVPVRKILSAEYCDDFIDDNFEQ